MSQTLIPSTRFRKHRTAAAVSLRAVALMCGGVFLSSAALAQTTGPLAPEVEEKAAPADEADRDVVLVTARNRSEDLQNVPIPISVFGADTLERDRVFTVAELTQRAPGLTATTPNARRTGVSIRGIGKTSGNDNMEPAVGVIVDDVFLGHVGMTYQDFTDLQQVEILRGPQGTLLGKNTSLGAVKYTSKAPSFTPEVSVQVEGGLSHESFKLRGSASNALVDGQLAYRVSAFLDQQEGDIANLQGGHWHERNRWGGKAQLLFTPSDTFEIKFTIDAAATDENSNTKPFMIDPRTLNDGSVRATTYTSRLARGYFGGYQPIIGYWDLIDMDQAEPLITENGGASIIATWDAGEHEFTSISAVRLFHFDAKNDSEQTRFEISRGGTLVDTRQYSQEFRLSGPLLSSLDYQVGLYFFDIDTKSTSRTLYGRDAGAFFATNAEYNALNTVAGIPLLQASLDDVFSTTRQNPESESQAVFGQLNWKTTDRAALTVGVRYTTEEKTNDISRSAAYFNGSPLVPTGNATANAIRNAQTGASYTAIEGDPIDDSAIAWLFNPSYQLTDNVLVYASASAGEKSGAVAFENNGTKRNVLPEKVINYELGLKSRLLDSRLMLNVNLYHTEVDDYQNVTSEPDPASATGYSSRLGNIPGIRARGVEFDANFDVTDNFSITAGGAYNDAVYTDWSTATCPRSFPTTVPVCDNSGKQIVGAPKWTAILGFQYETALPGDYSLRIFGNNSYRSGHNLEQLLSEYGYQEAYHLTDLGIGVSKDFGEHTYELSLVAKNAFDTKYTTSVNDFSNSAPVGFDGIGPRRYVGLLLQGTF